MLKYLFCFIVTFTFASQAYAQSTLAETKRMRAQAKLSAIKNDVLVRITAEGKATGTLFFEDGDDADFQAVTGTTNEQFSQYYVFMQELISQGEVAMKHLMTDAENAGTPDKQNEAIHKIKTIFDAFYDLSSSKLEEIVTPEQLRKMRQLDLQIPSARVNAGFPLIHFESYSVLDLSDSQKEQLDQIRDESLPEQLRHMKEIQQILDKSKQNPNAEEMHVLREKMAKKTEEGKKLIAKIRSRILVTLNQNQQKKLETILAELPVYVTNKMKPQQPSPPVDAKKFEAWKDSWKPGDPLPEEFRAEEKKRRRGGFPMMR